jgi:large subunit ribosomal protein L22
MGVRKRKSAEQLKEARKHVAFAKLNNCPTSPRKMRLMADLIRGEGVDKALSILRFSPKESSGRLEKLVLSCRQCSYVKKITPGSTRSCASNS